MTQLATIVKNPRVIVVVVYLTLLLGIKAFITDSFIIPMMCIFLLFFVIEEFCAWNARRNHPTLKKASKVSKIRWLIRLIISFGLGAWVLLFREYSHIVWLGAYIGFITNALVTVVILHIVIPIMQKNIANQFDSEFKSLLKEEKTFEDIKTKLSEWIEKERELTKKQEGAIIRFLTPDTIRSFSSYLMDTFNINSNTIKQVVSDIFSYEVTTEFLNEFMPQIETYIKELLEKELERDETGNIFQKLGRQVLGVDDKIRDTIYGAIEKFKELVQNMNREKFETYKNTILSNPSVETMLPKMMQKLQNVLKNIPDNELERVRDVLIDTVLIMIQQILHTSLTLQQFQRIVPELLGNTIQKTIENMKSQDISVMMDTIMGNILTSIEVLGAGTGLLFAWLMS